VWKKIAGSPITLVAGIVLAAYGAVTFAQLVILPHAAHLASGGGLGGASPDVGM
jgi:hypothetical protein